MYSIQKKNLSIKAEILRYKPAVYCKKAKEKYVYFYVLDPLSVEAGQPKLKRIRTKFNSYASARERDAAALRYRDEVNRKLDEGWNPLIESSSKKSWTPTDEVLTEYTQYRQESERRRFDRENAQRLFFTAQIVHTICRSSPRAIYI